jgi:SAM-dependent methyltransferase
MTSSKVDDNMERYYAANAAHYDTGLMRIGCTERQARAHASYFRNVLRAYYYRVVEQASRYLQRSSEPPIRVLDVGCGLGEDIHGLDRILPSAEFVGVEVSPTAVQFCNTNKHANMSFFCRSLADLSFEPQSFDLIVNFCVLEHVASPVAILQDCVRLLSDNGIIVSVVPNHYYWCTWDLPQYLVMKVLGRSMRTHSVPTHIMKEAFQHFGLQVLYYDVYGFRPAQAFFRHIPDGMLDGGLKNMETIGGALHRTFFEPFLYLELYVCSKPNWAKGMNISVQEMPFTDKPIIWAPFALPYFAIWWINGIRALATTAARRITGGHD